MAELDDNNGRGPQLLVVGKQELQVDRSANGKCLANGRYGDGKVAGGGTHIVV
jgi:hypothetical protein